MRSIPSASTGVTFQATTAAGGAYPTAKRLEAEALRSRRLSTPFTVQHFSSRVDRIWMIYKEAIWKGLALRDPDQAQRNRSLQCLTFRDSLGTITVRSTRTLESLSHCDVSKSCG